MIKHKKQDVTDATNILKYIVKMYLITKTFIYIDLV